MQIGLIGPGKMGFNLALNIKSKGHEVVAYDINDVTLRAIEAKGIKTVRSLKALSESLSSKRVIWLMIPAGDLVDSTLNTLKPLLSVGDAALRNEFGGHAVEKK